MGDRLAVCLIAASLALAGGRLAEAQTIPPVPVITVSGEAQADVVPDIARLSLGVEIERPTAPMASAELATAAQAVRAQLKADGIADADVASAALSLQPVYPDDGAQRGRGPRAFRAATSFLVTIRPAERAGEIASHLVDKGANTIDGIDYAVSDEPRRLDDLRAAAMRDALHKAQVYTGALGLHLNEILEITPLGGGGFPPPSGVMRSAMIAAPKSVIPTSPGTLKLSAAVTVRWAIATPTP